MVSVVWRINTSISPDWSAVKRCTAVSGTKRTLDGSPNTAAATPLQRSASRQGKARDADVDAAVQRSALADRVEGLARLGRAGAEAGERQRGSQEASQFHGTSRCQGGNASGPGVGWRRYRMAEKLVGFSSMVVCCLRAPSATTA